MKPELSDLCKQIIQQFSQKAIKGSPKYSFQFKLFIQIGKWNRKKYKNKKQIYRFS